MSFEIKRTKNKVEAINKTLYISKALADKVQKIASDNNNSFNNVVISMIESCLQEEE